MSGSTNWNLAPTINYIPLPCALVSDGSLTSKKAYRVVLSEMAANRQTMFMPPPENNVSPGPLHTHRISSSQPFIQRGPFQRAHSRWQSPGRFAYTIAHTKPLDL